MLFAFTVLSSESLSLAECESGPKKATKQPVEKQQKTDRHVLQPPPGRLQPPALTPLTRRAAPKKFRHLSPPRCHSPFPPLSRAPARHTKAPHPPCREEKAEVPAAVRGWGRLPLTSAPPGRRPGPSPLRPPKESNSARRGPEGCFSECSPPPFQLFPQHRPQPHRAATPHRTALSNST